MKKRIILFVGFIFLVLGIGFVAFFFKNEKSPMITFEECENAGGVAWRADFYHPDICPSCAEYLECELEYNDYSLECPECYGTCQECQDQYSLYESCLECYGPCQGCENEYLSDFESETERYELCSECERCDRCREEIETEKLNCLPCTSCNKCKKEHKKYTDIREVCPQIVACVECASQNFPYPGKCPDGKEKIGEISDAAIWFQCCK
jgi:hypothetical protein